MAKQATGQSIADPPNGPRRPLWPLLALATFALATAVSRKSQPLVGSKPAGAGAPVAAGSVAPDDHGRDAAKPSEIPVRGWIDILKRVYTEIGDDRVLAVAAGVTFYGLLAIFPAITALVSLYGLFADAGTIGAQLDNARGILPDGALSVVADQIKSITAKPGGSLGFATALGIAVSLWSANAGMKAMFDALNVVYEEKEKRSFIALNAISLTFTVAAIVVLLGAMAAVVVVPIVLNFFGMATLAAQLVAVARWPALLIVIASALAVLYRFGPSRPKAKWRWISWGSAFAALAWLAVSLGFSFYVGRFGSYNATYGALGAAVGFMTWIWLSTVVVLVGAEISAEIEHQTALDTTTGPDKPMGTRGATMADEIGERRAA